MPKLLTIVIIILLLSSTVLPGSMQRRRAVSPPRSTWSASITAAQTGSVTVSGKTIASSARMLIRWSAPGTSIDHYVITAAETAGGPPLLFTAASSSTSLEIDNLESGTEYRVSIVACLDGRCALTLAGDAAATARTDEEYWQIRGSGSSFVTADHIVADGNTKPYVLRWGPEAGAELAGRAQLYYDPIGSNEKGIKIGTLSSPITSSPDSIASFAPLSGFGIRRQDGMGSAGTGPATFQAVPLSSRLGAKVRMFWEAEGSDGRGRIYSLDSQDGWRGLDFHPGAPTQCQQSDLVAGGPCEPALLIGVEGDRVRANPGLREARQFKLLLPQLDRWMWDEEIGTTMVFTAHLTDSRCSAMFFNAGFAVWDGSGWNVQYDAGGCPKLIPGVQAPMPVHLGGTRYKLYFNHNTGVNDNKPLKILYAHGTAFEDWETIDRARPLHVLWPAGSELSTAEQSMFDDYHVWLPTGDRRFQVIDSNMTCPNNACGAPFIGMAVLVNP